MTDRAISRMKPAGMGFSELSFGPVYLDETALAPEVFKKIERLVYDGRSISPTRLKPYRRPRYG